MCTHSPGRRVPQSHVNEPSGDTHTFMSTLEGYKLPKGQVLFPTQALGAKLWQVRLGHKVPFFP